MKKVLSLLPILLALGSCQSDNAPTQADPSTDQIGVAARLVSAKALPQAQFFRARLTVGDVVGDWVDATYAKGAELILGKVKRGSVVVLDVRGYSVNGTDTLWKWFARKSDSATGSVLTIEAEVKGVEVATPTVGQVLKVPVGSWYTTDTASWANKMRVDSSGAIPALTGTVVLVRLRMAVPGTKDTLLGEVLRYVLPTKPTLLPANRALKVSDSVKISGAGGDSLVYCEGANCSNWAPYRNALPPKAFVLRARALRNGLVSPIEEAAYTLAPPDTTPVQPVDTVVGKPTFSPNPGMLASKDSIRISPAKIGDSIRYTVDGGNAWSTYSGPIKAGAFTVAAVSHRGRFHSDTVRATYTVNAAKPSSPTIKSSCPLASDCDPGTTVELSTTDTGVALQYALLADSTKWQPYAKFSIPASTKVFARAVRGSDTSAVQTATFAVVQPDTVAFSIARQTKDTAWVKITATSGTIWFSRGSLKDSSKWTNLDSLPVRSSDSVFAWTWRGAARSATKSFHAQSATPDPVGKPTISPNAGIIAASDSIGIVPAKPGDSIRYTTNGSDWALYSAKFKAGAFTVRAVAYRGGIHSDTASATYTLSAAKPSSPKIEYTCPNDVCDPGVSITLSTTDTGVVLQYALAPDTGKWNDSSTFHLVSTTKVFARAIRKADTSATQSILVAIAQPDTVAFTQAKRNTDTVWVKLSTTSGTIWYSAGAGKDSAKYSDTIPVRVLDSLKAWTWRGTARSATTVFRATASKPGKPVIATPTDSVIAKGTLVAITPAESGDSLQYRTAAGWMEYSGAFASGNGGEYIVWARAKRNGLFSDSVSRTFFVDTTSLAPPSISPSVLSNLNPGTLFTISVDSGSTLEWTNDTAKAWSVSTSPLAFAASRDTTIFARAKTKLKTSLVQTFAITIQLPDTVGFKSTPQGPDSVKLEIVPVAGDTVLYSRNADAAVVKAAGPGSVTIEAGVNDSITAWTKRGTAFGAKRGYRVLPVAPKPPTILPRRSHVHDTTDITLTAKTAGDSLSYRIGTSGTWTPYGQKLALGVGNVTVFARSTRHGLNTDTSVAFAVHAKPDTVEFTGCTNDCDPGTELTITAKAGYVVKWAYDTTKTWTIGGNVATPSIATDKTIWAYADSSGHRSKAVSQSVTIKQPANASIASVKVVRTALYDSAYYTIKATQVGDTLISKFGNQEESKQVVTSSPLTRTIGVERTYGDSILMVWTKRGNAGSQVAYDTLSRLPAPKNVDVGGLYLAGRTFRFAHALDDGALTTDTIRISSDKGQTWRSVDTVSLLRTTEVWAKSRRLGPGGRPDSSAVFKISYGIDSSIVSSIVMLLGDGAAQGQKITYDVTTSGVQHSRTVPDTATTFGVEFDYVPLNGGDDVVKYEVRCDSCTDNSYTTLDFSGSAPRIDLRGAAVTGFTFRFTTAWGFARTHSIIVRPTAPWNASIQYGTVSDSRDGQVYKTVTIGGKTWMAENLRYLNTANGTGETCYDNDTANCREYGRLYTWSEAMGANLICDTTDCSSIPLPSLGICPYGYHLPDFEDWKSLAVAAGTTDLVNLSSLTAPTKLQATSREWNSTNWFTGTDDFGFRALPSGYYQQYAAPWSFERKGVDAIWWMANQSSVNPLTSANAYQLYGESVPQGSFANSVQRDKLTKFAVRCVEDVNP